MCGAAPLALPHTIVLCPIPANDRQSKPIHCRSTPSDSAPREHRCAGVLPTALGPKPTRAHSTPSGLGSRHLPGRVPRGAAPYGVGAAGVVGIVEQPPLLRYQRRTQMSSMLLGTKP